MMNHKYAIRKIVQTGESSRVEFGEIDAVGVGKQGSWHDGFPTSVALLIVNKWNYVATLSSRVEFVYFLPAAEGTCEILDADFFNAKLHDFGSRVIPQE
jgi:hypothetical protein